MGGLVDSEDGLKFGESLQFQDPIGGAGLIIETGTPVPAGALLWGAGNYLEWGAGNILTWG